MNSLSWMDWAVIALYFFAIAGLGLQYARRTADSKAYFLAGRRVGWLAVGASLFITGISAENILALAASGATSGLVAGQLEWLASLMVLFLGWLFAPVYIKNAVFTVPEFLGKRFNHATRIYLAGLSLAVYIITKIAIILYAGSFLLHRILGWDTVTASIVLILITGLYAIAGGLSAVIYTQVLQAVVLIGGATLLTFFGLNEVGGIASLTAALPDHFFHLIKPFNHPDFPWTGVLLGAPVIGIWYWCADQYIVQRVLSARNAEHARSGATLAGFLKLFSVFFLVLPGLIAVVLFPEINSSEAYSALVASHLLPAGLRGLVIAGLLAAIMSSLAGCFNSCASLFTMDIYRHFRPAAAEQELVLIGRLSTAGFVLLAILWVPLVRGIDNLIFLLLQSVQVYVGPPVAAVFIAGMLHRRLPAQGAMAAMIGGGLFGFFRLAADCAQRLFDVSLPVLHHLADIHFLHFAFLSFVFSLLIFVAVALWRPEDASAKAQIGKISIAGITTVNGNYRLIKLNALMSGALMFIIFFLWIVFF